MYCTVSTVMRYGTVVTVVHWGHVVLYCCFTVVSVMIG